MQRAFMPSQHYDDFTLSSVRERDDYEEEQPEEQQQPYPLKSTLPSHQRESYFHSSKSKRPTLSRAWSNGPEMLQRDFARSSGGEDDVTLSTDIGTAMDEYAGVSPERKRATTIYEDDSLIPGVGRGHHKAGGLGTSSYSAHRDILASSQMPMHPSPATAHRHEQLRGSSARESRPTVNRLRHSPLPSATSDGEDSESGNETSSTSISSVIMQHHVLMRSKAESTGNHQAYTETQHNESPVANRHDRPKLDSRALDEMDRAVKKGRATMRQHLPDSPSPVPSRAGTPRDRRELRSRKEERLAQEVGSPSKPSSRLGHHRGGGGGGGGGAAAYMEAEGSNSSSGYAAGTRKPSNESSTGRKQAGTDGSTTGDTLVDERGNDYLHAAAPALQRGEKSPFMKLPSGQKMGRGVGPESVIYLPDLTGMSSALESPVKTVLGVQHRPMMPEVIQGRHIQTNETRLEEFNELAHYVKSVEKNLDQTQKKVEAVEDTSKRCAKEVNALRNEWSSWRTAKDKEAVNVEEAGNEEEEVEEEDDYEGKVKAINDHIAHLSKDLHSYRTTMEQMRAAKQELEDSRQRKLQEKQHRHTERKRLAAKLQQDVLLSSSPIKQSRSDEEDEANRLEMSALRKQVIKVAKEVERLRNIVESEDDHGKQPAAVKSARFASSMPPIHRSIGVGTQSPFARAKRSAMRNSNSFNDSLAAAVQSSSDIDDDFRVRASSPPPSVRGFSDAFDEDGDEHDGDETVRQTEQRRFGLDVMQCDEGDDVSIQAQDRAERTFASIKESRRIGIVDHDEKSCTVCGSKQKNGKRRQARKERVSQQPIRSSSSSSAAAEDDEHLLLSLLEAQGTSTIALPKNSKHYQVVQRLLKEHMDEFYHHRLLYCELADELKQYEPSMNRVKRRILAEHVMEAVEGLEFRAKRINILQVMVGASIAEDDEEQDNLNHYKISREQRRRRPRNSPPIVDGGDLYRRVVSA